MKGLLIDCLVWFLGKSVPGIVEEWRVSLPKRYLRTVLCIDQRVCSIYEVFWIWCVVHKNFYWGMVWYHTLAANLLFALIIIDIHVQHFTLLHWKILILLQCGWDRFTAIWSDSVCMRSSISTPLFGWWKCLHVHCESMECKWLSVQFHCRPIPCFRYCSTDHYHSPYPAGVNVCIKHEGWVSMRQWDGVENV